MKNIILLFILGLSLTTYSQDIERMDKKELRIALQNSNTTMDSLISINSNKVKEIASLSQNLIVTKDSIKAQKVKITSLLSLKKQSDENCKILTTTVAVLKDSIQELKMKTPFIVSSFTLKTLPQNCCMVYSESKELYKLKKYICYWGEKENDDSLIFYLNNKKIILKRVDSADDEQEAICYSDEEYFVKISKRKILYQDDIILIKESAEFLIKNLINGQEIIKKIYGEGGC